MDNTPAIRAFAEARVLEMTRQREQLPHAATDRQVLSGRIDEASMIVTLCDGLARQNALLKSALPDA